MVVGNSVCSVCGRNKTVPLSIQQAWKGVVHLSREIVYCLQSVAKLDQFALYLKATHFLIFPMEFGWRALIFLWYTIGFRQQWEYVKAIIWIVVKNAIITVWHGGFALRSYSLILSGTGPQLFSCLSCCWQGCSINATQSLLGRHFNSDKKGTQARPSTVAFLIKMSIPIIRNFGRRTRSNLLQQD